MVLNLINFIEAAILWILLIPELLFAIHHPPKNPQPKNKVMSIIEQIGRYSSMILMILPLGIMEFGFKAPEEMMIYFAANGVLLLAYIVIFLLFSKKQSLTKAMILALIRIAVFALCGVLLRHWFLVASAAIFAIGHLFITAKTYKEA